MEKICSTCEGSQRSEILGVISQDSGCVLHFFEGKLVFFTTLSVGESGLFLSQNGCECATDRKEVSFYSFILNLAIGLKVIEEFLDDCMSAPF